MLLDAMLAEPELTWLATDVEKLQHFTALAGMPAERLPHLSSAAAPREPQFFPDKFPIAIDLTGRVVFLYLATDPEVGRFRAFLQRHFELLRGLPAWTLRIVVPPWPAHLGDPYVRTAREDLTTVLSPSTLEALRWYFGERRRLAEQGYETPDPERFDHAKDAFNTPRYHLLYRRWLTVTREQPFVWSQATRANDERHQTSAFTREPRNTGTTVRARRRVLFGDHSSPRDPVVVRQSVGVPKTVLGLVPRVIAVLEQPIKRAFDARFPFAFGENSEALGDDTSEGGKAVSRR